MNIIFNSHIHGKSHHFALQPKAIIASLCVLLALPLLGALVGYSAGKDDGFGPLSETIYQDVQFQQTLLEQIQTNSSAEIKALTRRFAALQARITRIDALGERLVDVAKLRNDEFDFSTASPIGGPAESDLGAAFTPPAFMAEIDQLAADIELREEQLAVLESLMQNRKLHSGAFIAGRPIQSGWLSSRYGKRTDPFTGRLAWHKGVDFAGAEGSDVISVASGVVTWSGSRYGYGLLVEVNHGRGFVTRYGHSKENVVEVGEVVKKGQVIAKMGSTGRSTGPHVHFEVLKNGKPIDPTQYVLRAPK